MLVRERKRADRSDQPLRLVLVTLPATGNTTLARTWRLIVDALVAVKRETDVVGWFKRDETLGLILSEVAASDRSSSRRLGDHVRYELFRRLNPHTAGRLSIQLCVHPAPEAAQAEGLQPVDSVIPFGSASDERRSHYEVVKRGLDIMLSAMLLALSSPIFLVTAALVKLTSRGPVLFRQERIGQMMTPFVMLKFRTMRVDADHAVHRQFVSSFIKTGSRGSEGSAPDYFKIVNDSRVTPIGRILRRTSLDELPQLWNVLRGDMSLVGPRPPLPYEVAQYMPWHARRVLEAKPGMTGLWQVTGRSRTTFDEMVRLDLRYAKACSFWTDLRILLATPRAVISGKGAF